MSDQASEDLKKKILEYLGTVNKAKNRDVAKAINEEKHLVDKAIGELSRNDEIVYLYLDGSYVKLKGK